MSSKAQAILDWLEKNRRPEIRIQFKKAEQPLAIGASKIGGCPDVPADFVWPRVQGGGSFGNPNAQPEPMEIPDKNMAMKGIYAFLPGGDAKTFEEFRVAQIAYRQETRPDFQMPTGERLEQFEKHILDQWQAMQMGKALQDELNLMGDIVDMSDEEWEESFKPDPEDEKRAKMLRPLAFMAQFNLAELADLDKENLLPKQGHLLLFYDEESGAWGERYDKDCVKVFYFPPETQLSPMPLPDDLDKYSRRLSEVQLSFVASTNTPSIQRADEKFGDVCDVLNEEDTERLWGENDGTTTKLLGYADIIHNDMEEECVLHSHGWDWDDYNDNPKIKAQIDKEKDDWILLFQLGSISWGDTDDTDDTPQLSEKELEEHCKKMQENYDKVGQAIQDAFQQSQEKKTSFLSSLMDKFGIKADDNIVGDENEDEDDTIEDEDDEEIDLDGFLFGQGGFLYVFIRKQDLAAGDFSQVRFAVQS